MVTEKERRILDCLDYDEPRTYEYIIENTNLTDEEVSKCLADLIDRNFVSSDVEWEYRKTHKAGRTTAISSGKGSSLFSRIFLGADYE